ncbi:serine dehydratase beta chain [Streptomyces sp. NPDC059894]|uniref:serine dehydratase beta chain n=1 Tax=unclassified Streptomyces TaxID=2593676 RepID=UPI0036661804
MRAARGFAQLLASDGLLDHTASLRADLFGSLAATGPGHGTDKAILLGPGRRLTGDGRRRQRIPCREPHPPGSLAPTAGIPRDRLRPRDPPRPQPPQPAPRHPNGMRLTAFDRSGSPLRENTYYSIGGGFVIDEKTAAADLVPDDTAPPHSFRSGADLLRLTAETDLSLSALMLERETAWRPQPQTHQGPLRIWTVCATASTGDSPATESSPAAWQSAAAPQPPHTPCALRTRSGNGRWSGPPCTRWR